MKYIIGPERKTLEATYDKCIAEGFIQAREVFEQSKIKTNLKLSEIDFSGAMKLIGDKNWNSSYKLFYDSLHALVEAFLMFENVKSYNHQCLFAYLCQKHPELELDWYFFERIRMRRNGINYYGKLVNELMWKQDSLQFELYISLLKKEIQKRLKE